MTGCRIAFDEFLGHVLSELSRGVPEFPTHMGLFEAAGESIPQDRFTDISDAAALDRQYILRSLADKLAEFPRDELRSGQQTSAEVLDFFFDFVHERDWVGLKGRDFTHHEYLIRPSVGLQSDLPLFLSDLHPMRHEQDAADYLERLFLIAPMLTEAGELIVERQQEGFLPPRFLIQDTIREVNEFMSLAPRENVLYQAFANKSEDLAETLSLQEFEAQDEPGLWRLPNGEAYYEFLLRTATTTAMTADDIHQLGLAETEKLEAEILHACRDLGYDVRTIGDCHRQLDLARKPSSTDNAATRRAIVRKVESLIEDIESHLPKLFHDLPKSEVVVKPIPGFAEASRNQTYQPPSLDGSRPGLFELNLGQLMASGDVDIELPTLVYHEIFPGHHLQLSLALETNELPMLRRIITFDAYVEGWAKYSENIPWTHGINTDPHWRVARMRRELISTVNLVLDTGIHVKRWTVSQGVDYLQRHTGMDETFARYLVHRSASVPAQMCSYKIGMLKMLELKERMSTTLGAAFDIRDFHAAILRNGAVPLALLDRIVDREIEARSTLTDL